MKRSEAAELIGEMILLYRLENLEYRNAGYRMLDFIERLGMLPPKYKQIITQFPGDYDEMEYNEWEAE